MKRIGETQVERDFLIGVFKDIGYKYVTGNVIGNNIIHEDDLMDFMKSPINLKNYDFVMQRFFSSEEEFKKELLTVVAEKMLSYQNTAFLLRKGIFIKNRKFFLMETKHNSYGENPDFKYNIYTVSNQFNYKVKFPLINKTFHRIPDLMIFMNGIPFSLLEFKYANRYGQTSRIEGRKQILMDGYKKMWTEYLFPELEQMPKEEREDFKRDVAKLFEKPVHCVTLDMEETYVHRFLRNMQQDAINLAKDPMMKADSFFEKGMQEFRLLPQKSLKSDTHLEERVRNAIEQLYSPENIDNEILYYNFLGEKGELKAPRPNQKFGVDKTINHVKYLYENEGKTHFCLEQLEKELSELPESQKNDILERRGKFKNNKEIYSLLLQYSAGFGKSLIIAWLALRLKDFYIDNAAVFKKILIVADRLDLRDQMGETMGEMNIDDAMIAEVDNADKLKKSLSNEGAKIIIVNIQKFKNEESLNKIFTNEVKKDLEDARIAFLIDEIHRSNAGSQHDNMKNLFDDLHDNIEAVKSSKKNLIIGLTATPSDPVLARFGEYSECHSKDIIWKPFDSFTMQEAVDEGFVLDPTKNLITIDIEPEVDPVQFKTAQEKKAAIKGFSNKTYYENDERSKIVARYIVKWSMEKTFQLIRGRGKSMVASYSIESAIQLFKNIKEELETYFNENPKVDKAKFMKNFEMYIVYTGSSDNYGKATQFNDGLSEKKVIQNFKKCKNGIIVVVDKLQTGFDVKELNALFLDKSVQGINAVQTLSRVNRTTKNKEDCYVIDFSRNNANKSNISTAFKDYANLRTLKLDPLDHDEKIEELYKRIIRHDIFKKINPLWKKYQSEKNNTKYSVEIQNQAKLFKKHSESMLIDFIEFSEEYLARIAIVKDIIDVDEKYIIKDYYEILKEIKNSVFDKGNKNKDPEINIFFEDDNHSIVNIEGKILETSSDFDVKQRKISIDTNTSDGLSKLMAQIAELEENQERIQKFKLMIESVVEDLLDYDKEKNRSKLINEIQKSDGSEDQINNWFGQYFDNRERRVWGKNEEMDSEFLKILRQIQPDLMNLFKRKVLGA